MQLETELGVHDREAEIERLRGCLIEAVNLLSVECRAYRDNDHSRYTDDQRRGIAGTLERFCKRARKLLSQ